MKKTDKTTMEVINGKTITIDIYEINIDDLLFNPYNTRINDLVETRFRDNFNEDDIGIQNFIYGHLKETHNDSTNKKLKNSLVSLEKIIHPPIITPKNILLSGNNRLSIIRSIREENKYKDFMNIIEVGLIEEEFTKSKIIDYELSLQNEIDIKKDYETMSKVFRIHEYKTEQLNYGNNEKLSNEQIAVKVGVKENQVDSENEIAKLYIEYLHFLDIPNQKDFYRSMPIHMHLDALKTIISKQGLRKEWKIKIKENYFSQITTTKMPVQKLRDLYNKVTSLKEPKKIGEYLNKIYSELTNNEDLETVKEDIQDKGILDSNSEIGVIREKNIQKILPKIDSIVHELNEEKKKFNNSVEKALSKLSDSNNDIKFVIKMLPQLSLSDIDELEKIINEIEENIDEIKSHDPDQ